MIQQLLARAAGIRQQEQYRCFSELAAAHIEGQDFSVLSIKRNPDVLLATPHGGVIEPGTDLLVQEIAERFGFSCYAFKSHLVDQIDSLRITSARFDDPRLLELTNSAKVVLGIHTCPGGAGIFVGGGAENADKNNLIKALRAVGHRANPDRVYPGQATNNFCNRAQHPGFQLEIHERYLDRIMQPQQSAERESLVVALGNFMSNYAEKLV